MAVFGVPVVHETTRLALRAAVEMRAVPSPASRGARRDDRRGRHRHGGAPPATRSISPPGRQAAQPRELDGDASQPTQDAVDVESSPLAPKGKAVSPSRPTCSRCTARGPPVICRPRWSGVRRRWPLRDAFGQAPATPSRAFTILGGRGCLPVAEFGSPDGAVVARAARRMGRASPTGRWSRWDHSSAAQTDPATPTTSCPAAGDELVPSGDDAWAFRKQLEAVAAETPVVSSATMCNGVGDALDLIEMLADPPRRSDPQLCMARPSP
jgi:hypothetical protein